MKIKIEVCVAGSKRYFRATLPNGSRETFRADEGEYWNRRRASEVKDRIAAVYDVNRDSIRFDTA